jgi:urease accessory protein
MHGPRANWKAELALSFALADGRTVLAERRHAGPLVFQKPLYPEGRAVCHGVVIHAPGGIAGGDDLALDVRLGPGTHVLLTTPSATKWYKSDNRPASQSMRFAVEEGAILEWLPSETILFDAADAAMATEITLGEAAVFTGWEITCLGRRASGESFRGGHLAQRLHIRRGGRLLWCERVRLGGGDPLMHSPVGLRGCHVFGSMAVAAGTAPAGLIDACRRVAPRTGASGITALPDIVAARYLGDSAEHARDYFEALRAVLRPWYAGRAAQRPRLWST